MLTSTKGDNYVVKKKEPSDKIRKQNFLSPVYLIPRTMSSFIVWFLCVIVLANIGIFLTVYTYIGDVGFTDSLLINVEMGNFYSAGIAMLAWGFYDFYINTFMNSKSNFKAYKGVTFFVSVFMLFWNVVFATGSGIPLCESLITYIAGISGSKMVFPIMCWIGSLLMSLYIYCVSWMGHDNFKHMFSDLDDDISKVHEEEKASLESLAEKEQQTVATDEGVDIDD